MHDLSLSGRSFIEEMLLESDLPAAGTVDVLSPYDSSLLATVMTGGADHVAAALDAAHGLFRDRNTWLSVPQRIAILKKTASLMEAQQDELALLAASEGGKPLADSRVEVTRAIDGIHLCIEELRANRGDVISIATTPASAGRFAFTQKEPIGVVVAVSAFNHPLNLIVHQVAPAVASGCPVIIKPASDTPLSCLNFVQLLRDAGLPPAWCQAIVADSNESAELLVTDNRVAFFSFIGSARVGWTLRSKLAPGTRCALEHGGVAPAVLLDDFDFDSTVASVTKGGFYHAGQVCVSVQRVFVPTSRAKEFAGALADAAGKLRVGDPTSADTEVGPLIRPAEAERVDEWVREAIAAGGKLLCGGNALDNNCYAPTVIFDPPADSRLSTQEVFGPVVCVYPYDDLDSAISQANSLPTAFQAAVFGKDIDRALHACKRLDATAVMINDHTAFRDDVMPFAGLRESGLGTGGIPYTMHDMQIDKMLVVKSVST
ncbi:MAG: acyl-CoA reductase-like NAD-dependent aldehyde dehydrogenase [Woeseiaceae bacterium]